MRRPRLPWAAHRAIVATGVSRQFHVDSTSTAEQRFCIIMTNFRFERASKGENMKSKIHIKSMVLGTLLGAVIVFSVAAATTPVKRTVWEYKVVEGSIRDETLAGKINSNVSAGWEFVSAAHEIDRL